MAMDDNHPAQRTLSMPAATLWQPWASAVAVGFKLWETRSWMAPRGLWGGLIAIHAGKAPVSMMHMYALYDKLPKLREHPLFNPDAVEDLPRGVVVATATLVDCVRSTWSGFDPHSSDCQMLWTHEDETGDEILEHDDGWGDYSQGRCVWRLGGIEALDPPIPARGRQGIWHWTHEDAA